MHDQLSGATDLIVGVDPPSVGAAERSDELRVEACALLERARSEDRQQRLQAAVLTGDLLDRARRALASTSLTATTFARVLRSGVLIRELADMPELRPEPLLDELIAHTTEHGLASHNAAAQALRGILAESRGDLDEAMDAAVNAMVTVELVDEPNLERVFASHDIATLLLHLGLVELAIQMFATAAADSVAAGLAREHVITLGNQVMSEIMQGMALERLGRPDEAGKLFCTAADHARTGLQQLQTGTISQVRRDHSAGFDAALGLVDAGDEVEARLRRHSSSTDPECRLLTGIVLARRLIAAGRVDQARGILAELAGWPRASAAHPQLRVALARHLAEADAELPTPAQAGQPRYVTALESELWAQWEARARDLRARLERERLRRKHGPIRALAAEDPLTGLPNRRALDELLVDLAAAAEPGAVAMVDLDGLRLVNQRGSHADGDATLRAVAVAVRGTLPGTDSVIRYGGDEFVLLMPNDDLESASAKVERVVAAVAALPVDRGFGVTASAGVVTAEPHESADSILVRADNAMTKAKESGGNQVRTG